MEALPLGMKAGRGRGEGCREGRVGKSCRRIEEGDPPGGKGLAWVGQKYLMDESDVKEGREGGTHWKAKHGRITADRCVTVYRRTRVCTCV